MRNFYAFLLLILIGNFGFSQTTISQQDFDSGTPTWTYVSNPTPYSTGSDDWDILSTNANPSGTTGNFWGIQDIDNGNGGGNFEHTLTFTATDVTAYESVSIEFDFYTVGFDSTDYLEYEVFYGVSGSEVGQGRVSLNKNTNSWTTITENIPNTANSAYIVLIAFQNGGSDYAGLDNFIIKGTAVSTNDSDTEVYATTPQISGATITAANTTTVGNAFEVLSFEVEDQGSGDALPTDITTMRFVPGANNTADWTDFIQGVTLLDGNLVTHTPTVTITDSEIELAFSSPISVTDNSALEFSLGLYLNTTNIVDGNVIQIQIAELGSFDAETSGSNFSNPYTLGDVIGNDFIIDVDATTLAYAVQPTEVVISTIMAPSVEIAYADVNGNIDSDYTGTGFDISLTTDGSFDATAIITAEATNGIAVFDNLIFDTLGTGIKLTASDDSTFIAGTYDSDTFNVIDLPASGWQITAENVEFLINFDSTVAFVNEGQFSGNGISASPAAGELNSSAWATTGMSEGDSNFGDTETSGDFSRGNTSGGVTSGGFYAFEVATGNYGFGAQPTASDWTPGDIVLKSQNKTTQVVTSILVEYTVYVYNNEGRSTAIEFYYGEDENFGSYNYVTDLDVITPIGSDSSPTWVAEQRSTTITGLSIADNDFFYLNWAGFDNGGSGSRDEFALDDIKVTFNPPTIYTYDGAAWSPSDPDGVSLSNEAIVIEAGNPSLTTNTDINTVVINPGASLTIDAGVTLTLTTDLTLESTSASYASLISDGTITGTVIYKRHVNTFNSTTGSTNGQNDLISAPVTNASQTFGAFRAANTNIPSGTVGGGPTTFYLFGPYDNHAASNPYTLYSDADDATAITAGTGYRTASTDTSTFTFTGDVLTGTVPVAISQGTDNEWNLIGNPYPSYINSGDFLILNAANLDQDAIGIYGYDGDAANGWTVINFNNLNTTTDIAPGQGFMVAAEAASATLNFTPIMRTVSGGDDFIVGRTADSNSHLSLKIENGDDQYKTDFYFNNNSTRSLDPGYDAALFNGQLSDFYMYSHLVENNNGRKMTIQSLNEIDLTDVIVPLGVNANQLEQITFSIDQSTLPSTVEVYLEDNVTNTFTLLTDGDYTITPNTNLDGIGRFYLRFTNTTLSTAETTLDNINIYSNASDKTIVVAGQLTETTTATIYDIQGRKVSSTLLHSSKRSQAIDVSTLSIGVYVVELVSGTQNKTQKVILQ
ncbi:T9SS type A sorting domain-containing protein [uncultured Winogradskyella sp.]|uniref:T9SS type A sorting domain-containing protein n=1 Tax=uncultured Winogradskyella sp. TaxID=395353 RepID=UPI00260D8667|nr:T9SS type A sorting domain-containing protein [uncultured Winogradskyella sp.]